MNIQSKDNVTIEVLVRAQVMMRDDSTGGWLPMGGGGLSNVSVRKRKLQHEDLDPPCRHEYLIHGKRISDNSVVLNCSIKKDFEYNKVMPTFHHWKTSNKKFGLTFQTAADARAFDKGVKAAVQDLLDGLAETSPLHQYNQDVDEDVFMQLDLPLDKGFESRSPLGSSSQSTPSPLEILDSPQIIESKSNSPPPATTALMYSGSDPTHSHLHFPPRTRYIVDPNRDPKSSSMLYSDKEDNYCVGTDPYVKFPWREPPHEYSYPKLVDTFPDDGKNSSRSSFKRTGSLLKKLPSSVSDLTKPIDSCSSIDSNTIYDSSLSRSGDGKGRQVTCQLLPTLDPGSKTPPKTFSTMTLTCANCRENYTTDNNPKGCCKYAPSDGLRTCIEAVTCIQCAKCMLYHCMSDTEGDYVHPCECSNSDGHWARRWFGLSLLSILVPCLCCYVPLIACYKCGTACKLCGGRHVAS